MATPFVQIFFRTGDPIQFAGLGKCMFQDVIGVAPQGSAAPAGVVGGPEAGREGTSSRSRKMSQVASFSLHDRRQYGCNMKQYGCKSGCNVWIFVRICAEMCSNMCEMCTHV